VREIKHVNNYYIDLGSGCWMGIFCNAGTVRELFEGFGDGVEIQGEEVGESQMNTELPKLNCPPRLYILTAMTALHSRTL
jgi:hypothetical protein